MLGIMLFANFVLIYVPGVLWLSFWLNIWKHNAVGFAALMGMGVIPFIAGDITKAVLAAAIARAATPKTAYSREVDADKWATWRIP